MRRGILVPKSCIFLVFVFLLFNSVNAQVETKLTASDGEAGDGFGRRVAIDGEYIIVGASYDDNEKGIDAGAAYVFINVGGEWVETQKLLASDVADTTLFGYTVDIDGDYAVIGACWSDEYGEKSGSAYIFKLEGTSWVEQTKLTAHDAEEDDRFGISAAISGDYAVVGSFFDDDSGSRSGSAYIFKRNGTSWIEQVKLVPSDGAADDWFGVNVSIDGDYAVIGSRYDDNEKGIDAGAVYIFKREGSNWIEQTKLMPIDSLDSVLFEVSAIEGDNLIVGAWKDSKIATMAGSFYIFKRDEDNWLKVDRFFASDVDTRDHFGSAVAISRDRLVIGAYLNDDDGGGSGSSYIFRWDGANWYEEMKITASDGDTMDYFGSSVDIDQNFVVVAARQDDDKGEDSGAVYVYQLEPTSVQEGPAGVLTTFELTQNYPNPFNPSTKIEYKLYKNDYVKLNIYNSLGQVVKTLIDKYQSAGRYVLTWDGTDEKGVQVPSGEYFYQILLSDKIETKKAILIK